MRRAFLIFLTLIPAVAQAWGFAGHRRLASKMQDAMPANHCLRNWYSSKQTFTLQDSACDPDRWRGTDSLEAPRHYLNIDWVNPITDYPRDYAAAEARLGPTYARTNGTVPWRVQEKYEELVAAFRSGDETTILQTSFVLSHYVFDSFSVLHDTKNFDPNGLHERWESEMFENATRINAITNAAVPYYGTAGLVDPRNHIFDIVVVGNGLAPQLVAFDEAASANVVELYNRSKDLTARRWGDGITTMSSILWTAWNEAGRPALSGFSSTCSRAEPTSPLRIVGYPSEQTVVDAGVDAGVEHDGGVDAGPTGGGSGGFHNPGNPFGPGFGGGGGSGEGLGCVCTNVPGTSLMFVLGALALLRARRRS